MTRQEEDGQVVVFGLGAERFALPVGQVREILDHRSCFRMPHTPDWLLGLTDIRGESVPVVDLRLRLGLEATDATLATRWLVVELPPVEAGAAASCVALVVDRVLDVSRHEAGAVEAPPAIAGRWHSACVAAILRHQGEFAGLLDLASLFAGDGPVLPGLPNRVSALAA